MRNLGAKAGRNESKSLSRTQHQFSPSRRSTKVRKLRPGAESIYINLAVRRTARGKSSRRNPFCARVFLRQQLRRTMLLEMRRGGAQITSGGATKSAHTSFVCTYGTTIAHIHIHVYGGSLVNESTLFVIRAACASLSAAGRNSARVLRCKLAQNE
jgi:hypothetical protein